MTRPVILLGGIGGDSHSVGLTVLRQGLQLRYQVRYLGPQTLLEDFFCLAATCNVVMISCMDGHARRYLRTWPELAVRYPAAGVRWYLGGNPVLENGGGNGKVFLEMGFDRVFTGFVDVRAVLECLEQDLHRVAPARDPHGLWQEYAPGSGKAPPPDDERIDEEIFLRQRRPVLEDWRTGPAAGDLALTAEFLARQPCFHHRQGEVRSGRRPILIQPRAGVALVEDQIRLFKALRGEGASVLSYQVDSLTRNNSYRAAEQGIIESRESRTSTINGFPVVNHGVGALRRIIAEVGVPLQTRHSTRRPQLLAEISYSGGVSAFEGGAICYNIPYYKDYPLHQSLAAWQYVDRLSGLFYERYGIVLDRELFGTLTATLIPPSLAIVTGILEALLAVQQGVKSVSLGYAEQGNRSQDIAAVRTMQAMAREILDNAGYRDVHISSVFHQYMAAFPESPGKAEELITQSAATAALSGAVRVLTKTPIEAHGIPGLEHNIAGIRLVRTGLELAQRTRIDEAQVREECAIIRREVRSLFDHVVLAGGGSIMLGIIRAFEQGLLDIPFSPSIHNRGLVLTARDRKGAVRYLHTGRLPFDPDLRSFHEDAMGERCRHEGLVMGRDNHLLVERDVLAIPRGRYERWPFGA